MQSLFHKDGYMALQNANWLTFFTCAQGIAPFGQDICILACAAERSAEPCSEDSSAADVQNGGVGAQSGTNRPEVLLQQSLL